VYQVGLQKASETVFVGDPTLTKLSVVTPRGPHSATDADKTTFVASAGSFLDIFCVEQAQQRDDEVNNEAAQPEDDKDASDKKAGKRRRPSKLRIFLSELVGALNVGEGTQVNRLYRWGMTVAMAAVALGAVLYFNGASERELKNLIDSGDYAPAAVLASRSLASDPDNVELKTLGTEALLKADVPRWMDFLKRRDFARAAATIGDMKKLSSRNPDAQAFVTELDWMGSLEQFVSARGGADVEVKSPADAERIKTYVKHWNDDMQGHQRAFITISSYVPEFRDVYAEALSHLRKLELTGSQNGNERQSS
jgi:hypothetical protein